MENAISLGQFLKHAREEKGLSLRRVEALTGVSNPYLSQLESDKIKQPSPLMLHKLCDLYEISYETAMRSAGYPVPNATGSARAAKASRLDQVTPQEEDALVEYLEFLRSRGKKGGRK